MRSVLGNRHCDRSDTRTLAGLALRSIALAVTITRSFLSTLAEGYSVGKAARVIGLPEDDVRAALTTAADDFRNGENLRRVWHRRLAARPLGGEVLQGGDDERRRRRVSSGCCILSAKQ